MSIEGTCLCEPLRATATMEVLYNVILPSEGSDSGSRMPPLTIIGIISWINILSFWGLVIVKGWEMHSNKNGMYS